MDSTMRSVGPGFKGTILITGANGSLGLSFVECLLKKSPSYFAILAVRDDSESDPNTSKLRAMISGFPSAKVSIEALDLASLSDVRVFADRVKERVSRGLIPPISSVICNAFSWSLLDTKFSLDNYELGFQVSHLSHFLLVLKILESIDRNNGRIVFLGSEAHDSARKSLMNPLGAKIPDNIEEIVMPIADKKGEEMNRGFQRYSNAKLANVMFMHALNRRLIKDPICQNIRALAMDPGGLPTSRAFQHTPLAIRATMYIVGHLILPLVKNFTSAMKTTKESGADLFMLSVDPQAAGFNGYFEGQKPAVSSASSLDEVLQERMWTACEMWTKLDQSETILSIGRQ